MTIFFGKRKLNRKIGTVGPWVADLKNQAERPHAGDVVFDISQVETINSEELSAIAQAHLDLTRNERRLKLVNALPQVKEVFEITRMDRLIQVVERPLEQVELQNALKVAGAAR